jgi:hypothetical protein
MSPPAKKKCRRVDVVTVKGSEVPIGVYTYDCLQDQVFPLVRVKHNYSTKAKRTEKANEAAMSASGLPATSGTSGTNDNENRDNRVYKQHHFKFCTKDYDSLEIFELDADLLALRSHITPEFEQTFQQAVDLYISGDWANARPLFEKANQLMLSAAPSLKGDGPCKTLLRYMEAHNWSSQSIGWKGYRPLTSK